MLHIIFKYLRLFTGLVVLFVGIFLALPLVPGPGIPLIILGLVLLSDHFTWAKRSLHWIREKWQHVHWKQSGLGVASVTAERTAPREHIIGRANLRD